MNLFFEILFVSIVSGPKLVRSFHKKSSSNLARTRLEKSGPIYNSELSFSDEIEDKIDTYTVAKFNCFFTS